MFARFGAALILVSACAENRPPESPRIASSKKTDAILLAASGPQLTVTPLASAPLLEIRSARLDGSAATTLYSFSTFDVRQSLTVTITPALYDRVFSAALVFRDGHRLVSSIRVPGSAESIAPAQNPAHAPSRHERLDQPDNTRRPQTFLGHPTVREPEIRP
ncbi:MAG: hypothetical protein HYY84_03190 [Deltaproteobacteria bacterium]|nr:hypothetical protein [Deltaproteobacteria bacterium]